MTRLNANNNGRVELRDDAQDKLHEVRRIGAERRAQGLPPATITFNGAEAATAAETMRAAARARGLEI